MAPLAWVGEGVMFAWAASPARIAPAWQFAALGGAARLDKAGWARGVEASATDRRRVPPLGSRHLEVGCGCPLPWMSPNPNRPSRTLVTVPA